MINIDHALSLVERYKELYSCHHMFRNDVVYDPSIHSEPRSENLYHDAQGNLKQKSCTVWELEIYPSLNYMHYTFLQRLIDTETDFLGIIHYKEFQESYKKILSESRDLYKAVSTAKRVHCHIVLRMDSSRTSSALSKFYHLEARMFNYPQYDKGLKLDGCLRYLIHGNSSLDKCPYDVNECFGSVDLFNRLSSWVDGHHLDRDAVMVEFMDYLKHNPVSGFRQTFNWFQKRGYMKFYHNPQFYRWICDATRAFKSDYYSDLYNKQAENDLLDSLSEPVTSACNNILLARSISPEQKLALINDIKKDFCIELKKKGLLKND